MTTYIADTLNSIDTAIIGYGQSVFTGFVGPVTTMIQAGGLVGLPVQWSNYWHQVPLVFRCKLEIWGILDQSSQRYGKTAMYRTEPHPL